MLGHVTSTKWRSVQSRDSLINVKGSCRICEEFWSWHSAEQDLAKRFPSWVPGSRDLGATATPWLCSKLQLQDKWTASLPPSSPPFSLPPALPSSVLSCVCDEYIGQQVCVCGGGQDTLKRTLKGSVLTFLLSGPCRCTVLQVGWAVSFWPILLSQLTIEPLRLQTHTLPHRASNMASRIFEPHWSGLHGKS